MLGKLKHARSGDGRRESRHLHFRKVLPSWNLRLGLVLAKVLLSVVAVVLELPLKIVKLTGGSHVLAR